MRSPLTIAAMVLLLAVTRPAHAGGPENEAEIRLLADTWERAWNARDATALGALMAEEVDFTSVLGPAGRSQGREGFIRSHATMFQTLFTNSVWSTDGVEVDVIRPDVAIAHVAWSTTGDRVRHLPPGTPRRGKFLWVLEKRADGWRVVASQNTEVPAGLPPQR